MDNTKTLVSVDDDKKVDLAENLVGKPEVKAKKLGDLISFWETLVSKSVQYAKLGLISYYF